MSRVLVVDDDARIRELASLRLQKAGHRVLTAGSGHEALALVTERGAPYVAVLDVTMPGMSGFELLPAMRAVDGLDQLPAIFLSGRVEQDDVEAGRARGRDLPHQALQRERAHPHAPEARARRDRLVAPPARQAARAAK